MSVKLNITRNQLSTFLKDQNLILQFERLFDIVSSIDSTTPGEVSVDDTVSEADRKSVQAFDVMFGLLTSIVEVSVGNVLSEIVEIKKELDSIKSMPQKQESLLSLALDFKTKTSVLNDNDAIFYDSTFNKWTPRSVKSTDGKILGASVTLTNGSGSSTATLTNAPVAGNPTKWLTINDNGTDRKIPAW